MAEGVGISSVTYPRSGERSLGSRGRRDTVHSVLEALDAEGKRNGIDLEVLRVVLVLHGEVHGVLEALDAGVNHLCG
jgi:hypothetical protein